MNNQSRNPRPARACRRDLASRMGAGLLILAMPFSGPVAAQALSDPDFVDNRFEDYYIQPCLDGFAVLNARGWSFDEITEYNNAICAVVFNLGTFNSSETYSSTSNIGSIGAQTKTSDSVARQQVDSVASRLDEIQEEEEPDGGWGLLLSAQTGETEREATNREVGYDSDLDGFVGGGDYRFGDGLVVGVALGVTTDEASYENNAGELETESRSLMAYATRLVGDNAYIDGYLGFATLDYKSERDIRVDGEAADSFGFTGVIDSDFDGDQLLAGVSGGLDWYRGNMTYGVFGALDYVKTEVDGYEEEGGTGLELEYPDQESKSLTLMLGVNGSYAVDMGWGQIIPNASIAAVYQGEDDSREFDARLLLYSDADPRALTLETDSPDREYLISTLGVVFAMNGGNQFFATYEVLSSHDFLDTWAFSVGLLAEF